MAAFLDDALISDEKPPQTLCDWVKNFRIKKVQMKRKYRHGSNLRICAMLTTALNNAEEELKRKQQERFNKWAEMQSKFGYYSYNNNFNNNNNTTSNTTNSNINNIYYNYNNNSSCASELRSSSYSYYNNSQHHSNINNSNNNCNNITSSDGVMQQQQRDSINDLWKSELSGLDQFMKNMSSRCSVIN